MILVLENTITDRQKDILKRILSEEGCITREITDAGRQVIGVIGRPKTSLEAFRQMAGVADAVPIKTPHKLVSREFKSQTTRVRIGNVVVGEDRIVMIAGPCAVESRDQALIIASEVRKYGAVLFRGGAYKPRTSPYAFQGLEEEGLKILAEVRERTGMGVITEITSVSQADLMKRYVDAVQVGARNMQNYELLKCVGRMGMPVVLKRGLCATIQEWLMSAEYIMAEGNDEVVLCERGIRTFEPNTRNTLDLSAIPVLRKLTHLPIVIDPSHATGSREKVSPMARAAIAAGADGLMIEVHHEPEKALSDGVQSLYPEQFGQLARDIYVIAPVVGKQLDFDYLKKTEIIHSLGSGNSKTAAFIGEYGAYSHIASLGYFGEEITPVPLKGFRDIFNAVQAGTSQYGIVPLENSLSGSIHENYDLLQEYDLKIVGEITIRVKHALIAHPCVFKKDIRKIYAPPPAFSQCRNYLDQYPDIELIPVAATSSAVRLIKDSGDRSAAAIGSTMAARIFDMEVMAESIEDNPRNYTRFAVIAKDPAPHHEVTRTSIIFSTGHQPGALFEVLKVFSENQINLVKLESRPMLGKPWEYMFYADLEADLQAPEYQTAMDRLTKQADNLRILGRYGV